MRRIASVGLFLVVSATAAAQTRPAPRTGSLPPPKHILHAPSSMMR